MARVRYTTTIQGDILRKAKVAAAEIDLNANDILERALDLYFKDHSYEIWEKELQGGWTERLIITNDKIYFETIRDQTEHKNNHLKEFYPENLSANGWKNKGHIF